MKHFIFLSYPKPFAKKQKQFTDMLSKYLSNQGLEPRTLGATDYDTDAPLKAIRRLMLESNGLLAVVFRRNYIIKGTGKPKSDMCEIESNISDSWLTSPYCQIERAMAFQLGLPNGLLEKGVLGVYMPEFNVENSPEEYFKSKEFLSLIQKWIGYVRTVVDKKGEPTQLFK